jgi:hypothetical protein
VSILFIIISYINRVYYDYVIISTRTYYNLKNLFQVITIQIQEHISCNNDMTNDRVMISMSVLIKPLMILIVKTVHVNDDIQLKYMATFMHPTNSFQYII